MKEIELIERLENRLNEHCERLEKHLQVRIYRLLNKIEDEMYEKETQKIVEEHAAAERAIQNNGWVDFDADDTSELIDDENYLIRQQDSEGRWGCPHMAYWLKEEQEFYLLHTLIAISPKVDQYFKIPE